MKKILLPLIASLFIVATVFGQTKEINPCGTPGFKSVWLKKYQANPKAFEVKSNITVNVPITIHRVGRNNRTGKMSESALLRSMCTLQRDFEGSELEFYIKESIRDINNSTFYQHDDVVDGGIKMFDYNVEGTINCYFVEDAAGNCGYNLPWAGVCVQEACAGAQDHTWAHELGHALSLPHPFLGWEGGVSHDGSVGHDFNDPAPEFVLYNYTSFKDSLIQDTIIIDTAYVEKMDGSNCQFAADGFCDTRPDYLANRWGCQTDTTSFVEQTDPDGVKFRSDGSLFMSYALDNCSDRFSAEQMMAMRANALDEKGDFTSTDLAFDMPDDAATIQQILPFEDDVIYYKNVDFAWSKDNMDQYYLFQIGVEPSFSVVLFDTIVTASAFRLKEVDDSWGRLYWRVKPFTANNWCTGFSGGQSFRTTDVSATEELADADIRVYPNLLTGDQRQLIIDNKSGTVIRSYELIDMAGQKLQMGELLSGQSRLSLPRLKSGMYFVKLRIDAGFIIRRIMVAQ